MAIRVFFARMLYAVVAAVQWVVHGIVYRLDYARRYRQALLTETCLSPDVSGIVVPCDNSCGSLLLHCHARSSSRCNTLLGASPSGV